jgi:sulfide:quinone oxidoreductase
MELSTTLSEQLGDTADVTLIDKSDHFVFGYSKLDIMFARQPQGALVRHVKHSWHDAVRGFFTI